MDCVTSKYGLPIQNVLNISGLEMATHEHIPMSSPQRSCINLRITKLKANITWWP